MEASALGGEHPWWTEGGPRSAYPGKPCLPLPSGSFLSLGSVQPRGRLERQWSKTWGLESRAQAVGCRSWGAEHGRRA